MNAPVYLALLHYPMVNKRGDIVTTAVTNMDIHDISRSARTYGLKGFCLVTPVKEQQELVNRILSHWTDEAALKENHHRVEAVKLVKLFNNFNEVKSVIEKEHGEQPEVVLTDAKRLKNSVSFESFKKTIAVSGRTRPIILVFGTGWGVSEMFFSEVHTVLDPVFGPLGDGYYNHLSVRAAVAVILDRLFGR